MKGTFVFGVILSCFLLLITPCINAVEYNEIIEEIQEKNKSEIINSIPIENPSNIILTILQFIMKLILYLISFEVILNIINFLLAIIPFDLIIEAIYSFIINLGYNIFNILSTISEYLELILIPIFEAFKNLITSITTLISEIIGPIFQAFITVITTITALIFNVFISIIQFVLYSLDELAILYLIVINIILVYLIIDFIIQILSIITPNTIIPPNNLTLKTMGGKIIK